VHTRLLVNGVEKRSLVVLDRVKGAGDIELQALGNLVLKLELGTEHVGGGPGLREDQTFLVVGVLGLDITRDDGGLSVVITGNFECDIRRCLSLYFKRSPRDGEIFHKEIIGALAKVLPVWWYRLWQRHGWA